MKIGIDAKWFFEGPPSGRIVVRNLVEEILKRYSEHYTFYIFLKKSDRSFEFPYKGNNIHLIYTSNLNNLLANVFILPYYANKLKLDVLLFQNFGTIFKIKRSIVYIHDLLYMDYPEFYSFKERLYLKPLKFLAKRADTLVTISETEKKRIISHALGNQDNVFYVHHGISNNFRPLSEYSNEDISFCRQKYSLPDEYILYLGRLNIRKNIKNLIKALIHVKLPLVIVGKEDHKTENISELIKELNLENRIIFTGYVLDDEISLIYASATVFCFPSYAEGFGLPPLEAMACGVPVITSDRTSLPEVCNEAALYVNPDSPDDIADKINFVMSSDKIRKDYSQKGTKRAKEFTWKNSVEGLMNIIERKI